MLLRIFTEPQQGASYDQLLAVARTAEALGFDAFFRSDHYLAMGNADGLPGPTDAWVTLAAIARETTPIRLGTLVTSATFRLPGPLAISVAEVDDMSGGRVELGLGAGWYEAEHTAYGIPFPPLGERFERLDEQLAIISGPVVDAGRGAVHLQRPALPGAGQPGPAQARAAARAADHRRRRWAHPDAASGRPLRSRVQSGLPVPGRHRASSSSGSGARARPTGGIRRHWCCPPPRWCVAGGTTPKWPGGPRPSGRRSTSSARTGCAARPTRWWPSWPPSPAGAPPASTCRSSTSTDLDHLALLGEEVLPHCAGL